MKCKIKRVYICKPVSDPIAAKQDEPKSGTRRAQSLTCAGTCAGGACAPFVVSKRLIVATSMLRINDQTQNACKHC